MGVACWKGIKAFHIGICQPTLLIAPDYDKSLEVTKTIFQEISRSVVLQSISVRTASSILTALFF